MFTWEGVHIDIYVYIHSLYIKDYSTQPFFLNFSECDGFNKEQPDSRTDEETENLIEVVR